MPTITAAAIAALSFMGPELPIELTDVREVRAVALVDADENSWVFPSDQPGLFLKFNFEAPAGSTVLNFEQPERIRAIDSTGRDLTNIEPNFSDIKEFVSMGQSFGDAPSNFTVNLDNPSRAAETFSVATSFGATVFAEIKRHNAGFNSTWTAIPTNLTNGQKVEFSVGEMGGNPSILVRPGTAKDLFEQIYIVSGGNEASSNGAMWNDQQATFFFDSPANANNASIAFDIRFGLETIPVKVFVKDQPLP
ncbi:MAG: hypothetical protein AAGB51_09715 [Planctomycetota bacterium]